MQKTSQKNVFFQKEKFYIYNINQLVNKMLISLLCSKTFTTFVTENERHVYYKTKKRLTH